MKVEWLEQDGARMWRGGGFASHEYEAIVRISFSTADIANLQSRQLRDVIPALKDEIKAAITALLDKG
jgi:hypothetical protein